MEKAHKGTGTLLLLASLVSFKNLTFAKSVRGEVAAVSSSQVANVTSPAARVSSRQVCEHTRDAGTSRPGTPRSGTS